jgi:dTDP-4-dehydrorhamnose 3,5-epimerase-like enzyme
MGSLLDYCSEAMQILMSEENLAAKFRSVTFYSTLSDHRGHFYGITNQGVWKEVNVIHTRASQVRGGHFHRYTTEVIFMLAGKANVILTSCDDLNNSTQLILSTGEGIEIPPKTLHDFHYLEDSSHLQLLDLPFDPNDQDLFTRDSLLA